ncbi:MAG: bifunctional (p)ppGpp synthetase/guanosine-3',5'-bis(diphosphate) 3'-pyrophosphohydrolase [bacterium]|nr:bifunctional (p)ppGpp synthetase/guanosine-3',5'-bis(diphosphate) 3'-pyrophosphohydrolase [bacterium]
MFNENRSNLNQAVGYTSNSESIVTGTFFPTELKYLTIKECNLAFNDLVNEVAQSGFDTEKLYDVYQFVARHHQKQKRKDGTPYLSHLVATAKIVSQLKIDPIMIQAALLHDSVEEPVLTIPKIEEMFGKQVAIIVDGVTKINEIHFGTLIDAQAQNLRKMILAMSQDVRVILVKLADRLHNMTSIEYLSHQRQQEIARETLDIYAPIAHRLGIWWMKWRLEDLCFKVLDRNAYNTIREKVASKREHREELLKECIQLIKSKLLEDHIQAEVIGRAKHFYSIYKKMTTQGRSFDDILDLLAIRIIVDTVDQCYIALGIVHKLFTPNPEYFYDYIASPKTNGYKSIHTKVIGPEGHTIEVQIRTKEMDRESEFGLASHYSYKEGTGWDQLDNELSKWMRSMLDAQSEMQDSEELLQVIQSDFQPKDIFVISPKGNIYRLPKGSNAIDFAFQIHSDVGLHAIAAKVNGKIFPLLDPLPYGSTVEIITSEKAHPSIEWLGKVKTSRAKSQIKKYFQEIRFEESKKLGQEIVQSELKKLDLNLQDDELLTAANRMGYQDLKTFYAAIGLGEIKIGNLIRHLIPQESQNSKWITKLIRWKKPKDIQGAIRITGGDNYVVTLSECCTPVPGDLIRGFIVKGKGVIVHRSDCAQIDKFNSEQRIEVYWDVDPGTLFQCKLKITAIDRKGMLADIATKLSHSDININSLTMNVQDNTAVGLIIISVNSLSQLSTLINRLLSINGVLRVQRVDEK